MSLARLDWGDARLPPLVCLHGVTSHGLHFAKLAERLSDRFRIVGLDLRGHGASPWEPPWNLEQHVTDVLGHDSTRMAAIVYRHVIARTVEAGAAPMQSSLAGDDGVPDGEVGSPDGSRGDSGEPGGGQRDR